MPDDSDSETPGPSHETEAPRKRRRQTRRIDFDNLSRTRQKKLGRNIRCGEIDNLQASSTSSDEDQLVVSASPPQNTPDDTEPEPKYSTNIPDFPCEPPIEICQTAYFACGTVDKLPEATHVSSNFVHCDDSSLLLNVDRAVCTSPEPYQPEQEACLDASNENASDHEDVYYDCEDSGDEDSGENEAQSYVFEDSEFSSSDEYFDEPEASEHESGDDPLYQGAEHSRATVMAALLTLCMSHKLTKSFIDDLLSLLKLILPKDNNLVDSVHLFFKEFQFDSASNRHYFCKVCRDELNAKDDVCKRCGPGNEVDFFIDFSALKQLKKLFQREGFYESLSYPQKRVKVNDSAYEDVLDGAVYKDARSRYYLGNGLWITFMWNTDGFSLFKSSTFEIWPFYLSIVELPPGMRFKKENLILGGLWFGFGKPDPNVFLKPLLDELKGLKTGVEFNVLNRPSPVMVQGGVLCGTADSPARAVFHRHKFFNGLYGCLKCLSRGEKSERTGKVFVYPYVENLTLRTEANYLQHLATFRRSRAAKPKAVYGIKGPTILQELVLVSPVRSTSLDLMHNLFLGVFKAQLGLWFGDKTKNEPFNFSERKGVVSDFLRNIKPPHFIQRAPQSLDKLKYYKASEFKSFFFYYAVPIFSRVMDQVYFNHFLLLYLGISLLCKTSVTEADIVLAQTLLDKYVQQYENLYDLRYMTYNVHLLRHLPSVVRELGPLPFTSCFGFEDLNGILKYLVHGTQHTGLQVQSNFEILTKLPIMLHFMEPSKLKEFCLKLVSSNSRLHVAECLGDTFVASRFVKKVQLCALLQGVIIAGNLSYYKKLKSVSSLYVIQSSRPCRKDSSFISYNYENNVHHGILHTFVRVSQCDCVVVCKCPGEHFALIQRLECFLAFKTFYPAVDIFPVFKFQETATVDKVPVSNILGLCVKVAVLDKFYVTDCFITNYIQ